MRRAIAELLSSKKFLVTLIAVVAHVAARWGLELDQEVALTLLSPFYVWIAAQAHAERGTGGSSGLSANHAATLIERSWDSLSAQTQREILTSSLGKFLPAKTIETIIAVRRED